MDNNILLNGNGRTHSVLFHLTATGGVFDAYPTHTHHGIAQIMLHVLDGKIDNRRILLHKEIVLSEPLGDKREALIRMGEGIY